MAIKRAIKRFHKDALERLEDETDQRWLVEDPNLIDETLRTRELSPGLIRGELVRLNSLGHVHKRWGQAHVLQGDSGGWAETHLGVMLEGSAELVHADVPASAEPIPAWYALSFGEYEFAFTLAEHLFVTGEERGTDIWPSAVLLVYLWAKAEQREADIEAADWLGPEHLAGYRPVIEQWDDPKGFVEALGSACDEHARLTKYHKGVYLDFYADYCPVDIVGLLRVRERLTGEQLDPPDHPLMHQPIAEFPSVEQQPELRQHHPQQEALMRGALELGMLPLLPGRRAGSSHWPAPPPLWTELAEAQEKDS